MLVALAFVLLEAIDDALDTLDNTDPVLRPVTSWFEVNYIGV